MISINTFSNNIDYYDLIINQRLNVITGIKKIYSKKTKFNILANVISADEILRQISKYEDKKIKDLHLYFPNLDYVEKYIEDVSKKVSNIHIYLLNFKNDDRYMKNRDYITYEIKGINKKIEKLSNVKVSKVSVIGKDLTELFLESLTEEKVDEKYFNKYIKIDK
ncbi:hypothetical protein CEP89_04300 [Streptobacillus moniliformis]|uniref:Rhoptry protein n=2 Tax=Streptobacillus moniliformis TaxID=34105 RepID=D1AW10_STRM9|nr:hypothetical protein [Streptobacillus moniliformis]ACZ01920.1 rhoptry protein [Streptobacillus moniliformis DSM 12112]AVL43093.1 hypothetical protein CEP89_04300 [Streptobacillus moniliformis]SQA12872.1 Uncharacterised protein [Streptobacillus moniliformis]